MGKHFYPRNSAQGARFRASGLTEMDVEGIYGGAKIIYEYRYKYLPASLNDKGNMLSGNDGKVFERLSGWTKKRPHIFVKQKDVFSILKTERREI